MMSLMFSLMFSFIFALRIILMFSSMSLILSWCCPWYWHWNETLKFILMLPLKWDLEVYLNVALDVTFHLDVYLNIFKKKMHNFIKILSDLKMELSLRKLCMIILRKSFYFNLILAPPPQYVTVDYLGCNIMWFFPFHPSPPPTPLSWKVPKFMFESGGLLWKLFNLVEMCMKIFHFSAQGFFWRFQKRSLVCPPPLRGNWDP